MREKMTNNTIPAPPYFDMHITDMRTFYFTLHEPDGTKLVTSKPFRTPKQCEEAMQTLARNAIWAEVKDTTNNEKSNVRL